MSKRTMKVCATMIALAFAGTAPRGADLRQDQSGANLRWRVLRWRVLRWRVLRWRVLRWRVLRWRVLRWRVLRWRVVR